jgi:acetyl-CoA carboxylase alpha subunit
MAQIIGEVRKEDPKNTEKKKVDPNDYRVVRKLILKPWDAWEKFERVENTSRIKVDDLLKRGNIVRDFQRQNGDAPSPVMFGTALVDFYNLRDHEMKKAIDTKEAIIIGNVNRKDSGYNKGMARPKDYREFTEFIKSKNIEGKILFPLIDTQGADCFQSSYPEEDPAWKWISQMQVLFAELGIPIYPLIVGAGISGGEISLGVGDIIGMCSNAQFTTAYPKPHATIKGYRRKLMEFFEILSNEHPEKVKDLEGAILEKARKTNMFRYYKEEAHKYAYKKKIPIAEVEKLMAYNIAATAIAAELSGASAETNYKLGLIDYIVKEKGKNTLITDEESIIYLEKGIKRFLSFAYDKTKHLSSEKLLRLRKKRFTTDLDRFVNSGLEEIASGKARGWHVWRILEETIGAERTGKAFLSNAHILTQQTLGMYKFRDEESSKDSRSVNDLIELIADPETASYYPCGDLSKDCVNFHFIGGKYEDKILDRFAIEGFNGPFQIAKCKINGSPVILGIVNSSYQGGTMDPVFGRRFEIGANLAIKDNVPYIIITDTMGGARVELGTAALYQMVRTIYSVLELKKRKIPYIVVELGKNMGGGQASFAAQGDALITIKDTWLGFSGQGVAEDSFMPPYVSKLDDYPRYITETILPSLHADKKPNNRVITNILDSTSQIKETVYNLIPEKYRKVS